MRSPGRGMSMTMTFVQPMPISPPVIFNQPQNGQVNYNDNSRLEELQREVERLRSQVASLSTSSSSVQSSGSDYYRLQQDVDALKRKFVEQDRINDQVQNKFKRIDEALAAIGRAIQP
jgi:predicted RNase H-like nuclease (RuvC/YqgF family)